MKLRSLAAAVATVACAAPQAQENDNRTMEQVIVTGSRFVESLDEVPVSVTVIDREAIEQQLQVSAELQNLLAVQVPGLAPSNSTTSNFGTTLRGRMPLVMIDGVPQSTPLRNGGLGIRTLDPDVIERIEVVKGATSIYGNGAAGGIINYITKSAADSELAARASVSTRFSAVKLEDSAGLRTQGSVSGTRDKFSFVASASRDERGVERDGEGDIMGTIYGLSESVTQNFFTKLGYRLDDEKSLQLTYNYFEGQQNADLVDVRGSVNDGSKTYAVPGSDDAPGDPQGPRGNHNLMLKYVDDRLTDNTRMTVDAYGQVIENVFFFSPNLSNPDEGYDGGQSMIKSEKRGLRFNFNTQLGWDNVDGTLIYGLDALNDVTSQPLLDGRVWVPEMDMGSQAGYLQSKWILGEDWIFKAGVRHENIDLAVDDYRTLKKCENANPDICSVPMDVKGDELGYEATTYNLALRYHINDHFSSFANYSQGADISDMGRLLRSATVEDIALIQTEASIIDNYEIGLDTHFDDFDFSIAAFESTSELGTANAYNPDTGVYEPVRSPHRMWGYELALNYHISDSLSASANYSWVEGEDEDSGEYLDARIISPPKFVAHLDWRPRDNASLALTYYHVGDRKRFEPDADGNWNGAYAPVSAYDVVNLSANYRVDNWRFFAGIENLLNEEYFSARAQAYTYSGGAYHSMSLGTTVNTGVNYTF